eukprot:2272880-Rhodomonas_salina.2
MESSKQDMRFHGLEPTDLGPGRAERETNPLVVKRSEFETRLTKIWNTRRESASITGNDSGTSLTNLTPRFASVSIVSTTACATCRGVHVVSAAVPRSTLTRGKSTLAVTL